MNEQQNDDQTRGITEDEPSKDTAVTDDDFQVTVRKLEMPVRPRGVLAE